MTKADKLEKLASQISTQHALHGSLSKTLGDAGIKEILAGNDIETRGVNLLKIYRRSLIYRNQLPMTEYASLWKSYENLPVKKRLQLAQSLDFCKLLVMDRKKFDSEMLELARESGDRHLV